MVVSYHSDQEDATYEHSQTRGAYIIIIVLFLPAPNSNSDGRRRTTTRVSIRDRFDSELDVGS
jgi:hypothetical protein